ncbi:MAG: biotin--[acetyl-CoA-carboxylase] ligase [Bacteroidales bacterium]|nr:biotin--[acetyl-CoA-carboxylase] ligase [Bacteroidales bacterium]
MIIGSNIIYREKLSSTNALAAQMLSSNRPEEGTLIYAYEQSEGKGQKGNSWISEPGKNLTVSIILYPDFLEAGQQFMISKAVSLAIAELLDDYSASISIKWPNDIYHKDDKIAGILIENALEGNKIVNTIIGTGININQTIFPPALPNPVSLKILNKREYHPEKMLSAFCRIFDLWYGRLRSGHLSNINEPYLERLYRFNETAEFSTAGGDRLQGRIAGVDSFGRLIIESTEGNLSYYGFREIEFRH